MESIASHTPGPWAVDTRFHDSRSRGFIRAGLDPLPGAHVPVAVARACYMNRPLAEVEANARLIAAAPDLLAALRWLVEECTDGAGDRMVSAVGAARVAIREATGG